MTRLQSRSMVLRYGFAVVTVAIVLGIKLLLIRIIGPDAPFLLFFAAVMTAAWIGGYGPGFLATILAALANNYFFIEPFGQFSLDSTEQLRLALFVIEGIFISLICARLQAARLGAEQSANEARELEKRILEIADAEQRRIGHDLHDGLGQHMTGLALMTQQLEQRMTVESSPYRERAAKISALAATAVEWTHDLSRSLSSPSLETRGLAEALEELASNAENLFSIECTFEKKNEIVCNDLAATVHLYRIAQEAISNAVKHGRAKHVRVRLSFQGRMVQMQVADDGSGIESSLETRDGMGLRIMHYRAKMIGAQIDVRHDQSNGSGTIITCSYEPASTKQNGEKNT